MPPVYCGVCYVDCYNLSGFPCDLNFTRFVVFLSPTYVMIPTTAKFPQTIWPHHSGTAPCERHRVPFLTISMSYEVARRRVCKVTV
ncbi:hypothetical protein PBCV1_a336R [Paramecium bursaria Chlorella virus 1]|uniref:Uncharacterized protein n=1 Tax=Paramecium bursaria Chlorella virus 1 TaxID=10506 RepID=Q84650_PBCV1|nr:hypothetical protein PBCV1_a336R [Paramecium bursaria Chlorella virus 1]AAC96704.1 hypothetical protein [Paramecium bursaria Chlorella virus 1]